MFDIVHKSVAAGCFDACLQVYITHIFDFADATTFTFKHSRPVMGTGACRLSIHAPADHRYIQWVLAENLQNNRQSSTQLP
jgi:hypothetical protein